MNELSNMPPSFAIKHLKHGAATNAKCLCYTTLRHTAGSVYCSEITHHIIRQFNRMMSPTKHGAPMHNHVGHVVRMVAKFKMVWIHTVWVITKKMPNRQPRLDHALGKQPCGTVRSNVFLASPELAIPIIVHCAVPAPTSSLFYNIMPKSLVRLTVEPFGKCWVLVKLWYWHIAHTLIANLPMKTK